MSKERPILFSGTMVRAILDGRKTQTRRLVKPQPPGWLHVYSVGVCGGKVSFVGHGRSEQFADSSTAKCPYGVAGDRLWVRETWSVGVKHDCVAPRDLPPRSMTVMYQEGGSSSNAGDRSGWGCDAWPPADRMPEWRGKWRPSIHMPRWASRITLEIVSVRVERLQDISDGDAVAEGVDFVSVGGVSAVDMFESLWESINGGGSWAANPWVWKIEFRRVS